LDALTVNCRFDKVELSGTVKVIIGVCILLIFDVPVFDVIPFDNPGFVTVHNVFNPLVCIIVKLHEVYAVFTNIGFDVSEVYDSCGCVSA
jgi:hypothetical protein